MQQRYYEPLAGRFLSVDPVTTDAKNAEHFNRYRYAANNPYKYKDPTGRIFETAFDVFSLALSVAEFKSSPSIGNAIGVAIDAAAVVIPGIPGGVGAVRQVSKAAEGAATVGKTAGQTAEGASKAFSKEKQALVDMAKGDKKSGMTSGDMQGYKDLNKTLPDPFPSNKVRGPEAHSSGAPSSQAPHGHVGPVDHIPIKDKVK
jgi:uncharacterized protein RhaS with RHS repeats